MTPQLHGFDFRSNPELVQMNGTTTFRADYLMGASNWTAPEVWRIAMVFTGTIAAAGDHVGNAALGRDFAKIFANIKFRLQNQDVWQISGAALRVLNLGEWGANFTDPADVPLNTPATVTNIMPLTFSCPRQLRDRDTAIALSDFLDSGELTVTYAASPPTGWGPQQADWKVRLFAFTKEGRVRELKALRRVKEVNITNQELSYDIGGQLRWAFLTTALTTTGYTSLATITNLNSISLQWPAAYEVFMLKYHYQLNQYRPSALDEFMLAAPGAIPIVFPFLRQKIGGMPNLRTLHLDLLVSPVAGLKLITDTLVDRHPDAIAKTLGYNNAQQALAAVNSHGVVVGDSGNYHVSAVPATLRRHMPVRVKPGGVARQSSGTGAATATSSAATSDGSGAA